MEGAEIGLVLARASELRARLDDCIGRRRCDARGGPLVGQDEDDEAAEILEDIRDALESLERQLAAFQALQQKQRYEREATVTQIDCSRKMLLGKLKDYHGEHLDIIQEASAFAGEEAIDHDNNLLLPPYPAHLPELFVLDDIYRASSLPSTHNLYVNGLIKHHTNNKGIDESEESPSALSVNRTSAKGIGFIIKLVTKSVITFLGVASVISLAGIKPRLRGCVQFKGRGLLHKPEDEERVSSTHCPPRKVLMIEDGKPRCLIKERVEIPFESVVSTPNIYFGFG